jgi:hypothetical protein
MDLIETIDEAKQRSRTEENTSGTLQTQSPLFSSICPPFAVSSLQGSDPSEMDASLLMSESYSPPLHASDLPHLLNQLFDPENMSWLRHSAGRKYLSCRRRQGLIMNNERSLVQHSRKQSRSQEHVSGFSFTPRFRGYATNTKTLVREAALGHDSLPGMNIKDALLNSRHLEKNLDTKKLLQSANSKDSLDTSTGASTIVARRQSQTSSHTAGSDALELPKWSRPKDHSRNQTLKARYREVRRIQRSQREMCLKSMRAADPLGLVSAWEDWGRALVWGTGGGVLVGVVVALGRWWFAAKSMTE